MSQNASSPSVSPGPAWQSLGELELHVSSETDRAVQGWLAATLSPLELPAALLLRILSSARDVVARAMHSEAVTELQHLHLAVFAPAGCPAHGQCWGFFRIEKMERAGPEREPDHTIEFYMYLEGRPGQG